MAKSESMARSSASRVLLGVVGLIVLSLVDRFALSSRQPARPEARPPGALDVQAPAAADASVKRDASFAGHPYIYSEDPSRPGTFAVVFNPSLKANEELAYAVMRHAILMAYGRDLSSVVPEVSQQGEAEVVDFRVSGLSYVTTAAWNASHTELLGFGLHREE